MNPEIPKESQFAGAWWTWKDVKTRRPKWSQDRCEEFLDEHEDDIRDAMIAAGWDKIEEILSR